MGLKFRPWQKKTEPKWQLYWLICANQRWGNNTCALCCLTIPWGEQKRGRALHSLSQYFRVFFSRFKSLIGVQIKDQNKAALSYRNVDSWQPVSTCLGTHHFQKASYREQVRQHLPIRLGEQAKLKECGTKLFLYWKMRLSFFHLLSQGDGMFQDMGNTLRQKGWMLHHVERINYICGLKVLVKPKFSLILPLMDLNACGANSHVVNSCGVFFVFF